MKLDYEAKYEHKKRGIGIIITPDFTSYPPRLILEYRQTQDDKMIANNCMKTIAALDRFDEGSRVAIGALASDTLENIAQCVCDVYGFQDGVGEYLWDYAYAPTTGTMCGGRISDKFPGVHTCNFETYYGKHYRLRHKDSDGLVLTENQMNILPNNFF